MRMSEPMMLESSTNEALHRAASRAIVRAFGFYGETRAITTGPVIKRNIGMLMLLLLVLNGTSEVSRAQRRDYSPTFCPPSSSFMPKPPNASGYLTPLNACAGRGWSRLVQSGALGTWLSVS